MSGHHIALHPRSNRERLLALTTVLAILMSLMVIYAQPALAHHPESAAGSECDLATGETTLTLSSTAWTLSSSQYGNHDSVKIQASTDNATWSDVTTGAYAEPARSFSVTLSGSDAIAGATVEALEGSTLYVRSEIQDLQSGAGVGWYRWNPIGDDTGTKDYNTAASGNGNDANASQIQIPECDRESQPVTVVVSHGDCRVDEEILPGYVTVTIDPDSGATVTVTGPDSYEQTFTGTGDSDELAPGSYSWTASASDGYELTGDTSGEFTVVDCAKIILKKNVIDHETEDDTEFGFTSPDLDDLFGAGGEGSTVAYLAHQEMEMAFVPAGNYEIFESVVPDNWSLVSVSCDDDNSGAIAGNGAQYVVAAGETVTCTFNNLEDEVAASILVTVDGECLLDEGEATGEITVVVSVDDGATVVIKDGDGAVVDTVTVDTVITVPIGDTYTWDANASEGFEFPDGFVPNGEVTVVDCTEEPETGTVRIIKDVLNGDLSAKFQFAGGVSGSIGDGEMIEKVVPLDVPFSSTELVPDGWTLTAISCQSEGGIHEVDLESGTVSMTVTEGGGAVTCTYSNFQDEVAASVLVTVGGECVVADGKGTGQIDVIMSVAGGATVVIKSGNTVVSTLTDDGVVSVPEGATYTWEATANEGFEFPSGFVPSGAVSIETCSIETLPFTGIDSAKLIGVSTMLLGAGLLLVLTTRRREEI